MRWVPVAGSVLAICATASAGGTRKIDVDSDPAGAAVYLNDVDNGAACDATPCTIEAPIGTTPIIFRKDGYTPEISEITIPKKGKVKAFKVSLTSEVGTLIVNADPAFKGGKIFVDDIDKGPVPQKLEIPAGPHHAQVVVKGRPVADDILELDAGGEHEVKPTASAPLPPNVAEAKPKSGGFDDDEGGEAKPEGVKIKAKVETGAPRAPWVALGADVDVGFRQFKYDNAGNGLSPTESEAGQTMVGPTAELWPLELAGSNHLRGLSLFGKVEFGVNHQAVLDAMNQPVGPKTFWGNIEVDLRHRWHVGESGAITIEGGFVRDQLQFQADSKMDLQKVPYCDYKSIQIGVRAATKSGSVEPFAELAGRIVLSGGDLATRFATADTTGGHAAAGISIAAGPVYLRAQGAVTIYSWSFSGTAGTNMGTADGARDLIEVFSFVIGLTH